MYFSNNVRLLNSMPLLRTSVPPHPVPLPPGEGESNNASLEFSTRMASAKRWGRRSLSQRERAGVRENGGVILARSILMALGLLFTISTVAQTPPRASSDLLQFLDGSTLHGSLVGIESGHNVHWQHPAAREAIAFQPRNLHRLRFMHAAPVLPPQGDAPACRLRFANGDEVVGDLLALDEKNVVFKTWFGGQLTAPRDTIRTLQFIQGRSVTHYEGPTSLAEWTTGQPAGAWSFHDGVLSATQVGSIGRDVALPPRGRLELDLDWTGQISLLMSIYTESTRFDFNASGYMFIFGPGYVTLQRMQGIRGTTHMSQVIAPQLAEKNQAHIEIRADKSQGTLALLIDGNQVQQWTDASGFAGQGTGMAFLSQRIGPPINVSNIRVSNWQGEGAASSSATNNSQTTVSLINGDLAKGEVKTIREGKLSLMLNNATLPVPVERVLQIDFPAGTTNSASVAGLVRAELHSGASVTFAVKQWNEREVSGVSPHFGNVALKPEWIRQLVFNLDKPKPARLPSAGKDDLFWPFEK